VVSGLQWIRRRQRRLARTVLPLVALAWLQVAAIPCVAAHEMAGLVASAQHESAAPHASHDHDAHHGQGHGGHAAANAHSHGPCLYCPPDHAGHGTSGDEGGRCAFPHDPQVDGRAASLALAPPLAFVSFAFLTEPARTGTCLAADRPEPVPRCSLTVSYCRFIE
jgi:hypothetical protein